MTGTPTSGQQPRPLATSQKSLSRPGSASSLTGRGSSTLSPPGSQMDTSEPVTKKPKIIELPYAISRSPNDKLQIVTSSEDSTPSGQRSTESAVSATQKLFAHFAQTGPTTEQEVEKEAEESDREEGELSDEDAANAIAQSLEEMPGPSTQQRPPSKKTGCAHPVGPLAIVDQYTDSENISEDTKPGPGSVQP